MFANQSEDKRHAIPDPPKTQTRLDEQPSEMVTPQSHVLRSHHNMNMMSDTGLTAELHTQYQDTNVKDQSKQALKLDELDYSLTVVKEAKSQNM